MDLLVEAWTRWILVLAFDFWRYPDPARRMKSTRSGG